MCFSITGATMDVKTARMILLYYSGIDAWPDNIIEQALEQYDIERMDALTDRLLQTINGMKPIILGG